VTVIYEQIVRVIIRTTKSKDLASK